MIEVTPTETEKLIQGIDSLINHISGNIVDRQQKYNYVTQIRPSKKMINDMINTIEKETKQLYELKTKILTHSPNPRIMVLYKDEKIKNL